MQWEINSDCETVHIYSTFLATDDAGDYVTIDDIVYHSFMFVNQIVPQNFTVYFVSDLYKMQVSDDGFILHWRCNYWNLYWTEWIQTTDGSCNWERRRTYSDLMEVTFGSQMEALIGPTVENRKSSGPCGKRKY